LRGKDQKDLIKAFLEKDTHAPEKKNIYKSVSAKNLNILAGHPQKATCFEHHQFGV